MVKGNYTPDKEPKDEKHQDPPSPRKSLPLSRLPSLPSAPLSAGRRASLGSSLPAKIIPHRRHTIVGTLSTTLKPLDHFSSSFHDVFGYLGVPMVFAFVLSALAMAFTAVVQVFPDEIGNMILQTQDLDHGDLLMLSRPSTVLVVASTIALVVFCVCYIALLVFMFSLRNHKFIESISRPTHTASRAHLALVALIEKIRTYIPAKRDTTVRDAKAKTNSRSPSIKTLQSKPSDQKNGVSNLVFEFTSMEGHYHEYYVAIFDIPKLLFQTVTMVTYLKKGFQLAIVIFFALPLAFNWIISFYRFQRQSPDPTLVVTRIFYLFDLFFAVFAPIFALLYAYYNFKMDRANFKTREETLTLGSFDTIARLFADPVQIEVFRQCFSNMQLTKLYYLVIKIFLNLLGIYKWKKVIVHLIVENYHRQRAAPQAETQHQSLHSHSRRHLLLGATVFLCCSLGIAVYTVVAITTSIDRCANFPKCAVYSYVWHISSDNSCSCIVFIDRDTMPRTYEQWINAADATEQVRTLAASGTLETLQLINRAMPEVPEELRQCKHLKTLILLYSQTQSFPEWANEWTQMQYMHIEGDFIHYPIEYLPDNIFTRMHGLKFLRIAGAAKLKTFPSLDSQHHLSTLVITIVRSLHELPSFDHLTSLRTMVLAELTHIPILPSFAKLDKLAAFTLFRRNEVCCNGYATGYCDLNNFQCLKRENEPEVHCVDARMSAADHAVVSQANGLLCAKNITQSIDVSEPTRHNTDEICGGVMYRECWMDDIHGICYNGRMQVVHCDVYGEYEKMRRLQIARGVGDTCDPKVEAWLGCADTKHMT